MPSYDGITISASHSPIQLYCSVWEDRFGNGDSLVLCERPSLRWGLSCFVRQYTIKTVTYVVLCEKKNSIRGGDSIFVLKGTIGNVDYAFTVVWKDSIRYVVLCEKIQLNV